MIFYAIVDDNLINPAQAALLASGYSAPVITVPGTHTTSTLEIDTGNSNVSASDLSILITNAIGQYTDVSNTAPGGGPNMGAFLNSIGQWIRDHLKLPSITPNWWLIAIAVVLILVGFIFLSNFSKGLGEGAAARV